MSKVTINPRKRRINPDWEKRRNEREERIAEREKRRDEMFEKLVTAATTVIEELRTSKESSQKIEAMFTTAPARPLSESAQRIFDYMGREGYILQIRPISKACLVYPRTRGAEKVTLNVNIIAAYELIDSGKLRYLEVERRGDRLGLVELGLYAKGNFYCCLQ